MSTHLHLRRAVTFIFYILRPFKKQKNNTMRAIKDLLLEASAFVLQNLYGICFLGYIPQNPGYQRLITIMSLIIGGEYLKTDVCLSIYCSVI